MKRICILSFSVIAWDSRVLREIEVARKHFQVWVIGFGSWVPPADVQFYSLTRKNVFFIFKYILLFGGLIYKDLYNFYFWLKPQYKQALSFLKKNKFDLIHANDWESLPVACVYKQFSNSQILFDAHEYNLDINKTEIFSFIYQRYRLYIFKRYGDYVSKRITVAPSIEKLYKKYFNWAFDVILNTPDLKHTIFKPTNPSGIMLVHHGGAMPGRYLEEIIDVMQFLDDRYTLHLYLIPTFPRYLKFLMNKSRKFHGRVEIHDPIDPIKLISEISKYDIGIPLIRVAKESYFYSLPNKFFDFIMAGLMIIVSPLPMMMELIDKYEVGLYSKSSTSRNIADIINSLTPADINKFKKNSIKASKILNSEIEMKKLERIYFSLSGISRI